MCYVATVLWLKSASTVLPAPLAAPLTVLAGIRASTSFSIRAVGNSLTRLLGIRSPARTRAFLWSLHAKTHHDSSHGDPSASPCLWSVIASESAVFLFHLAVGFVIGVCVGVGRFAVPRPPSLSFWSALPMADDEEAGVEWILTRSQEELVHAWDVVVRKGYVPVRTLLGACCRDFYWPIRRRQFAWFNQVVFAEMNKAKLFRGVIRTQLLRDSTRSGGRGKNDCNAWRDDRWTIGRRAFFGLS